MITRRIVLVLGAGATKPYGYPLAGELIDDVLNVLRDGEKLELMGVCGVPRDLAQDLRTELGHSAESSIDAFLEYRAEFREAGRYAIALAIAPYEDTQSRPLMRGDQRWYEYLLGALRCPRDQFAQNQLSIVTFNYDRSLDQYLFIALSKRYRLDGTACAEMLSTLPLVHVYGQIGLLPWQLLDASDGARAYGGQIHDPTVLKASSQGLRVIGEAEKSALDQAGALLDRADSIMFLGFGYHRDNLELLNMARRTDPRKAVGTVFGLGEAAIKAISNTWPIRPGSRTWDIMQFFQNDTPLT